MKTLEALIEHAPEKRVYLGRELTKLYEEMLVGSPAQVHASLVAEPVRQKGEFVVIVE